MDLAWHERGACFELYPIIDMLPESQVTAKQLIADYCDRCKVVPECAAYAISQGRGAFGVWGGEYIPMPGVSGSTRSKRFKALAVKAAIVQPGEAA